MQYEDDFDDQNLYAEKNRNREGQRKKRRAHDESSGSEDEDDVEDAKGSKLSDAIGKPKILQKSGAAKKQPEQQRKKDEEDEDEEDDIEGVEKLLEGYDDDNDVDYLYQEDEKRIKLQQ